MADYTDEDISNQINNIVILINILEKKVEKHGEMILKIKAQTEIPLSTISTLAKKCQSLSPPPMIPGPHQ